jgi:hypothetical protein
VPVTPSSIRSADGRIGLDDFYAVPSTSRFLYMPTRELWPADSINAILPAIPTGQMRNAKLIAIKPADWLKQSRGVEQMTWAPGMPEIIEGQLISEGGWRDHPGARCLNLYIPPAIEPGDPAKAGLWTEHLNALYPDDAEPISDRLAHAIQRPGEKINHAMALGGEQGIGKDSLLAPVCRAVGAWNVKVISPVELLESFSSYVKCTMLQVNEAHDLGEGDRINRYALYERIKIYAAAPPDVLRCHEKFLPPTYVPNVLHLIITTNHKVGGLYLPPGDRRTYVPWSERKKEEFGETYFVRFWDYLRKEGGYGHVAAYLRQRDLSNFDPHAPPPRTETFHAIVQAGRAPEDTDLGNAIDELERPPVCSLATIAATKAGAAMEWLFEPKARRAMPHRMERCGYVACRNPNSERGSWTINDRKWTLYARADLSREEQLTAAREFVLNATKTAGHS